MSKFKRIALIGRSGHQQATETIARLIDYLRAEGLDIWVVDDIASIDGFSDLPHCTLEHIGQKVDLAIVVGGDGSLLGASRALANFGTPVLGINRGTLGFLTDIRPSEAIEKVGQALLGQFTEEKRWLNSVEVIRDEQIIAQATALNDVVLHKGQSARMLGFDLCIDDQFVYSSRSDGLIVSTPTGSTAYALSAGGPIMHPKLNALVLVPMFPHTLNARPIVVPAGCVVSVTVTEKHQALPQVSCDGQTHISLLLGDRVLIRQSEDQLTLLHPPGYSYYEVCRSKLQWGGRIEPQQDDE
ncbi:MAG: NAD(+) kinase [Pseudomonadota bacterium]|nr:NAD(+) kinase [Pseudomonadota bacterium]